MTMDKSLKVRLGLARARSVLNRAERIQRLKAADRWQEGDSPFGLAKVRVYKLAMKKKKKKKEEEEGAEGAEAVAGYSRVRRRQERGAQEGSRQEGIRQERIRQEVNSLPLRPLARRPIPRPGHGADCAAASVTSASPDVSLFGPWLPLAPLLWASMMSWRMNFSGNGSSSWLKNAADSA